MEQEVIFESIERILEEWDPTGILQDVKPVIYKKGALGEYTMYVKPIINTYLSNQSMYRYLVKLEVDLLGHPTNEIKAEIKTISEKIIELLSKCDPDILREYMKDV